MRGRSKPTLLVLISAVVSGIFVACSGDADERVTVQSDEGTAENTQDENKERLPTLLDFGRGRCIPCKKMKPILQEIAVLYQGKLEVEIIDVGEQPGMAKRYRIRLIPTQVFFDAQGEEVYRHEGFLGKREIISKLTEMGLK